MWCGCEALFGQKLLPGGIILGVDLAPGEAHVEFGAGVGLAGAVAFADEPDDAGDDQAEDDQPEDRAEHHAETVAIAVIHHVAVFAGVGEGRGGGEKGGQGEAHWFSPLVKGAGIAPRMRGG